MKNKCFLVLLTVMLITYVAGCSEDSDTNDLADDVTETSGQVDEESSNKNEDAANENGGSENGNDSAHISNGHHTIGEFPSHVPIPEGAEKENLASHYEEGISDAFSLTLNVFDVDQQTYEALGDLYFDHFIEKGYTVELEERLANHTAGTFTTEGERFDVSISWYENTEHAQIVISVYIDIEE